MVRTSNATEWKTLVGVLAVFLTFGCGFNPSSPFAGFDKESSQGTELNGRFSSSGGALGLRELSAAAFDGVTVEVAEDPAIKTSVASDGSFTLRGLPEGSFTLIFRDKQGNTLGEMEFEGVLPNSEITIVVQMTDSGSVELVDEQRTGIGHGELELEGKVGQVTPGENPNQGSLVVNGYTVLARPGVTAIREGNRSRAMDDLRTGDRVHVKGVWEDSSVLAYEIIIQRDDETNDDGTGGNQCANLHGATVGQRIELEGTVSTAGAGSFMLSVNGNRADGPIQVNFSGNPQCVGQAKKAPLCQIGAGDQVHVSGTLTSCTVVAADDVKIQKKGS